MFVTTQYTEIPYKRFEKGQVCDIFNVPCIVYSEVRQNDSLSENCLTCRVYLHKRNSDICLIDQQRNEQFIRQIIACTDSERKLNLCKPTQVINQKYVMKLRIIRLPIKLFLLECTCCFLAS